MNAKLDFDATKLYEALKYQIHVAMEYCHTLEKDDVLWIEVFGDVTVEGRDQIEVKEYSDSLTDSHENFWNTLNNWLKPDFNHRQYANLVLLTTQAYGERAAIKDWDQWNADQRLAALQAILKDSEARFEAAALKKEAAADQSDESGAKASGPSKALTLQRKVMAQAMRESLIDALPKVKIITEQPDLVGLIARYKRAHLKSIHEHRMDDFLNDLFGFMTSAVKVTEGWRFTTAEFDRKFTELTARYMKGSVRFPRVNADEIERDAGTLNVRDRIYAKKLDEIGGDEDVILEATVDLLHAHKYIVELIKDCTTSQDDVESYSKSHMRTHSASRSALMTDIDETWSEEKTKRASLKFYHSRCGMDVVGLGGYEDTPAEFRNGIYHMLAEDVPASPGEGISLEAVEMIEEEIEKVPERAVNKPIEHLFTLQRSPIALAPVIHNFFANSLPRERDLLLSYLVLPMVLYPAMQTALLGVRKTSNLRTLCKDQSRLVGLTHNTQQFKSLTNAALLILQAEQSIELTDDLTVKSIKDVRASNANPKHLEAARRLSMVCAEADVVTIYRTLGFKSL